VTVNGATAYRKGEYFRQQLPIGNGSTAAWTNIIVSAGGQASVSGNEFVPKTPELFLYDQDGNLTNDGHWAYTWDAENRLVQMVANTPVAPAQSLTYAYDYKGRRISKAVWNNTTGYGNPATSLAFLYDGWNLVAELNTVSTPALVRSYVWGSDLSGSVQGAGGVGGLLELACHGAQTTNCFAAFDGNGDVASLVNTADATLAAQYEYGPFGEVVRMTGPMARANPMRFSTKYQDDETDWIWYPHRPYSPSSGRWATHDPIREPGFQLLHGGRSRIAGRIQINRREDGNLYAFLRNSPLNDIDPLGLASVQFKIVRGTLWHWPNFAGRWSQPFWAGDGDSFISGSTAWSWVRLDNEFSWWNPFYSGWYCNTVYWIAPGDPWHNVGQAGGILVYLNDDCGGSFRVDGLYSANLSGLGPAPIYAQASLKEGWTGGDLSYQIATQANPITAALASFSVVVNVQAGMPALAVRYEPVLGFLNANAYGGQPSYGQVEALITINSITKLR